MEGEERDQQEEQVQKEEEVKEEMAEIEESDSQQEVEAAEEEEDPLKAAVREKMKQSLEGASERRAALQLSLTMPVEPEAQEVERSRPCPYTLQVAFDRKGEQLDASDFSRPVDDWNFLGDERLRKLINSMYPSPLPIQQYTCQVLYNDNYEGCFVCPSGQGRSTSWMVAIVDMALKIKGRRARDEAQLVIVARDNGSAEELMEALYLHIPIDGEGRPLFRVCALMGPTRTAVQRTLREHGVTVLIVTSSELGFLISICRPSMKRVVIDDYDEQMLEKITWLREEANVEGCGFQLMVFSQTTPERIPFKNDRDVIHVKGEITKEADKPAVTFAYVRAKRCEYERLCEVIDSIERGTVVVFVDNYEENLWRDIADCFNQLKFGFYFSRDSNSLKDETLFSFRKGDLDVLVGQYSERKLLESPHRTFSVYFDLPPLENLEEDLSPRRIHCGDSLIFLRRNNRRGIVLLNEVVDSMDFLSQKTFEEVCRIMDEDFLDEEEDAIRRGEERYERHQEIERGRYDEEY